MRAIHKYPLTIAADPQVVLMPKGAQFLSVQYQVGQLVMWWMVDPEAPKERRLVITLPTGHELHNGVDRYRYLGTVQTQALATPSTFVWHVFEVQ